MLVYLSIDQLLLTIKKNIMKQVLAGRFLRKEGKTELNSVQDVWEVGIRPGYCTERVYVGKHTKEVCLVEGSTLFQPIKKKQWEEELERMQG